MYSTNVTEHPAPNIIQSYRALNIIKLLPLCTLKSRCTTWQTDCSFRWKAPPATLKKAVAYIAATFTASCFSTLCDLEPWNRPRHRSRRNYFLLIIFGAVSARKSTICSNLKPVEKPFSTRSNTMRTTMRAVRLEMLPVFFILAIHTRVVRSFQLSNVLTGVSKPAHDDLCVSREV